MCFKSCRRYGKRKKMNDESLVVFGTYNGVEIHARPQDSYIDVTELCQAYDLRWSDYRESAAATRFLAALSKNTGISGDLLVIANPGRGNHTFADRRVALHCAAWINAEFEVWVYDRIEQL